MSDERDEQPELSETELVPPPPAGYAPPEPFVYPMWGLQGAALLVLVLMGGSLLLFLGWWHGELSLTLGLGELLLVLLTVAVVIVVHELVHGAVYRLLGYEVQFGVAWQMGAAYAAVFGQFQQRGHNFASAVAPLVVLTAVLFPLLLVPNSVLNLIGFTALLFNTSGAVGDLYLMWRLWRLPPGSLLYDVNPETMLIYRRLAREKA